MKSGSIIRRFRGWRDASCIPTTLPFTALPRPHFIGQHLESVCGPSSLPKCLLSHITHTRSLGAMSWSKYLPDDRLKWTEGYNSTPIWPSEPDLAIIREIASSLLMIERARDNVDTLFAVHFLADGARHKIYEVTHPSWTTSYLFRVAIPLDPSLKMESEMATMEFVRRRTTIPVPKPVAWSSSAANPLGFEWCLLEKAPGVELREVWRTMSWEGNLRVVDEIAEIMAQLWDIWMLPISSMKSARSILKVPCPSHHARTGRLGHLPQQASFLHPASTLVHQLIQHSFLVGDATCNPIGDHSGHLGRGFGHYWR